MRFNPRHSCVFILFSFFWEQNSLNISSQKWEPLVLSCLEVPGRSSRGREPSAAGVSKADRGAEDGKVESLVPLTGIREQFIHSRLWIYWFGHSFCQGDCKDGHTPHTHRLPSLKPEFILCQNIPRAGNPSLPLRFQINSKAPWDLSIALYQRPPADKACHKTATDRCHCSLAPRKSCCCKAGDAPPFFPFPGLTGHRLPPVGSVPWAV